MVHQKELAKAAKRKEAVCFPSSLVAWLVCKPKSTSSLIAFPNAYLMYSWVHAADHTPAF
jgi:hypothetical protein